MPYPRQIPGVLRVSQSSIETYLRCGIRYRLDQEPGIARSTVPLAIGSAVHRGAAADNARRIASGRGLRISEIVDQSTAAYDVEARSREFPEGRLEVAAGKDSAAAAARAYGSGIAPHVEDVLEAEKPIVAEIRPGLELGGIPDRVHSWGTPDLKTGREWSQADVDRARQPTIYGLLFAAKFGDLPTKVQIDNVFFNRGKWQAKRLWSARRPEDYRAILEVIDRAQAGIQAGVELPAPEGAWWCSAKWCPHYGRGCPATSL